MWNSVQSMPLPYGLNGPWTLLKASCGKSAQITGHFEHDVMRSLWPDLRHALATQSRRRDKRPPTLPLVVMRNGVRETLQVPRTEYPTYLTTPLFPPPAKFWSHEPVRGVFTNLDTIHLAGPTFRQAKRTLPRCRFRRGAYQLLTRGFCKDGRQDRLLCSSLCLGLGRVYRYSNQEGHIGCRSLYWILGRRMVRRTGQRHAWGAP